MSEVPLYYVDSDSFVSLYYQMERQGVLTAEADAHHYLT